MNTLPANNDVEKRCLSSLMKDRRDVLKVTAAGLSADHFSDDNDRAVFAAIQACAVQQSEPDVAGILSHLSTLHGRRAVTWSYLVEIDRLEPTSANSATYAGRVIGLSKQRKVIAALAGANEAAARDGADFEEIWGQTLPHLQAAQDCAADIRTLTLVDFTERARTSLLSPNEVGVDGPFAGWDRAAGRLRPGELCVLAARPGVGKTALALQYAVSAARSSKTAAIFSLEMTGAELALRMAVQRAGRRGVGITDDAKSALLASLDEISQLQRRIHVFESGAAGSIDKIEARCRLLRSGADGLGLIVVDYLQLVAPPIETRREHRERQVAEMSRHLKLLAQSVECPIMVLAQLNRESEKEDRRPRLSDLRESGAIEQDADRVWFLYAKPPAVSQPLDSSAERIGVELIQAKARNGSPWINTNLVFDRPCVSFGPQ